MKELLSSGESIIANKIQTIQIQSSAYPFRESAYMDYPVTPHHDKKIFSALFQKSQPPYNKGGRAHTM